MGRHSGGVAKVSQESASLQHEYHLVSIRFTVVLPGFKEVAFLKYNILKFICFLFEGSRAIEMY